MYEQSSGNHSCVSGEIYPSLAPESSSPRRTREPDSYVNGHLKDNSSQIPTINALDDKAQSPTRCYWLGCAVGRGPFS
jgi:hypothetical protein